MVKKQQPKQLFQHLSTLDEMLTAADTADGGG
jgi:hypothetical protein